MTTNDTSARHPAQIEDRTVGPMTTVWAEPTARRPATAVVVLPELFGLTEHVRDVCAELARQGHRAVAPDLYHRTPGLTVLPEDDEGRRRGFEVLASLGEDGVLDDLRLTVQAATADGVRLAGLLGLSVGGHLGFRAAIDLPVPAAVLVYPGWLDDPQPPFPSGGRALDLLPQAEGRILVVVGDQDHVVGPTAREHIAEAFDRSDQHELVVFPGAGHGYLAPHRATHDAAAAADTWARVEAHLRA